MDIKKCEDAQRWIPLYHGAKVAEQILGPSYDKLDSLREARDLAGAVVEKVYADIEPRLSEFKAGPEHQNRTVEFFVRHWETVKAAT